MKITPIPCLKDNYAWLIEAGDKLAVVDPPEAEPVIAALGDRHLDYILNTHHHGDHVGGNRELKAKYGCKVVGYVHDAHRIPEIDIKLDDNDEFVIPATCPAKLEERSGKAGIHFKVIFIPGHTLGHIAYYSQEAKALFCGDTIFSLGCGRLFEGTHQQMFDSLSKLKSLPDDTMIYCAHEYTLSNGKFAITVQSDNQYLKQRLKEAEELRSKNIPTLPVSMESEKKTNPFLIAKTVEQFAEIRIMKDNFRG